MKVFNKEFTLQEPIPEQGIKNAMEVLNSGRIHRYNTLPGENCFTTQLEENFAKYMGRKYCLACASCGSSIYLALKCAGVKQGDPVLCNAYTLAPVPGAIENAGGQIVLVEIMPDYTIDLEDLEKKAIESKAKVLLISHMRGHLADMDKVAAICKKHNITIVEDCAHTMGASWNGVKSGNVGLVGCYSTQTYKHMNSGEGGLFVTDDDEVIAKAIMYSGSYMLYSAHTSRPSLEVFEKVKKFTPNFSSRMDNLRAGILLPQLEKLDEQCARWNVLYDCMAEHINKISGLKCPERSPKEFYVGSSIQFNIENASYEQMQEFLEKTAKRGVQIKWFGHKEPQGFTSAYDSWQYFKNLPDMPNTRKVLATMCDMRLPLTFNVEDCDLIAEIIKEVCEEMKF